MKISKCMNYSNLETSRFYQTFSRIRRFPWATTMNYTSVSRPEAGQTFLTETHKLIRTELIAELQVSSCIQSGMCESMLKASNEEILV